ncbi:MAG TPA: hypothetical protein VN026_02750 [Bacteroidia bacterium]|jgi:hypothetical protein|nr:hypothetical protein [Bacteroidia bacterium]
MKKIIAFLFFCFLTVFCYSQTEKLNQFDDKGKKDGKWIVWLDKDWKLAADSMTAVYFRYNYWDHGANLYPMGRCGGSGYKLETISENSKVKRGNAKLLDGEYKWVNEKGHMRSNHILKEGVYVFCKEYYSNGNLETHFDYTMKCEGQPHSSYTHCYDKNGKLKGSYPFCEQNFQWPHSHGVDGG